MVGDGISAGASLMEPSVNSARRPAPPMVNHSASTKNIPIRASHLETRSSKFLISLFSYICLIWYLGSSMQMKTMEDQRRSALSQRTASNALQKSTSSKTMGVHGYYVAKVGIPKREPHYTIPRDENSNFFKHVTRSTKGIPGPNAYDKSLSWKTNNGQFGCGPARKTFTDEAAKLSR